MAVDRHKLWRIVRNELEHQEDHAPDGHEAVVDVYLLGRVEPVRLGIVQTTRDEWPWVLLQTFSSGERPPGQYDPDTSIVYAPEAAIARVEIHYVRSQGRKIGFAHEETDTP